jgi:hypothetical protein
VFSNRKRGNKYVQNNLLAPFKIKSWSLEMSFMFVVNMITIIKDIVANGIYDYTIFATGGKYNVMFGLVLGEYHNFMILTRFGFHK